MKAYIIIEGVYHVDEVVAVYQTKHGAEVRCSADGFTALPEEGRSWVKKDCWWRDIEEHEVLDG